MRSIKFAVLLSFFSLFWLSVGHIPTCGSAYAASYGHETWYGALIVTNQQALDIMDGMLVGKECRTAALVSFNFDDGYRSAYSEAWPIFKEYRVPATAFIITGKIGLPMYMTIEQMVEVAEQGGWEIASHSVTHSNLLLLPLDEQRFEIQNSKETLQKWGFRVSGFAAPYNQYNILLLLDIRRLYQYHRTSSPGTNPLPVPEFDGPGSRYELYYIEITQEKTVDEVKAVIERVNQSGGWAIITFHDISDSEWRWSWPAENLEMVIEYVKEDLKLCTFAEFQEGSCKPR